MRGLRLLYRKAREVRVCFVVDVRGLFHLEGTGVVWAIEMPRPVSTRSRDVLYGSKTAGTVQRRKENETTHDTLERPIRRLLLGCNGANAGSLARHLPLTHEHAPDTVVKDVSC